MKLIILLSSILSFSYCITSSDFITCSQNLTCDQTCLDLTKQNCQNENTEVFKDSNCRFVRETYQYDLEWSEEFITSFHLCQDKCIEAVTGDTKTYQQQLKECVPDPNANPPPANSFDGITKCADNSTDFQACDESCMDDQFAPICKPVFEGELCLDVFKYMQDADTEQELPKEKLQELDQCYSECEKLLKETPKKAIQAFRQCIKKGQEVKDPNSAIILNASLLGAILLTYFMIIV